MTANDSTTCVSCREQFDSDESTTCPRCGMPASASLPAAVVVSESSAEHPHSSPPPFPAPAAATQPASSGAPTARGWYAHPENSALEIYWDGSNWSPTVRSAATKAMLAPAMSTGEWQLEMLKATRSIKLYLGGLWWVVFIGLLGSLLTLVASASGTR